VLIIDEAQTLSAEVLDAVRLLSNFETAQDKLLQILIVGQPELATRLNSSDLRQLKQRVALRHHLRQLTLAECIEYIRRRLEIAGGVPAIFTAVAVRTVYAYSSGTPRLINIICDNGMLTAYALNKKHVDEQMIREVANDLNLPVPETLSKTILKAAVERSREVEPQAEAAKNRYVYRPTALLLTAVIVIGAVYWASDWTRIEVLQLDKVGDFFKSIYEEIKNIL